MNFKMDKTLGLSILVSIPIVNSILWIHALIVSNGHVNLNTFGEGWWEALGFVLISIYGLSIVKDEKSKSLRNAKETLRN